MTKKTGGALGVFLDELQEPNSERRRSPLESTGRRHRRVYAPRTLRQPLWSRSLASRV